MPISPQEAAIELLKRRAAKKSLASFIEYTHALGDHTPAKHHKLLIDHLEAVERGEINKLMVWMPPGSANQHTPVSCSLLGSWEEIPLCPCSECQTLLNLQNASEEELETSLLMHSYRNVFGFGCSEDTKAAGSWENERGGEFFAAGIG